MPAEALVRAGLDLWKRRSPSSFWRMRNGAALARWCWIRIQRRAGAADETYDAEFWNRQDTGDWDAVAALVDRLVRPGSIVDVGCGHGLLLEAIARRIPNANVLGIDDSSAAVARARARGLTVLQFDIAGASHADIEILAGRLRGRSLAICLEVAEHLPPWHTAKLLRLLTVAPVILFSAAHPNQGGVLHVNERPLAYWQARFAALGYERGERDRELRTHLQAIDLPPWYAENAQLFERTTSGGPWRVPGF